MKRRMVIAVLFLSALGMRAAAAADDTLDAYAYRLPLKVDSRPFQRLTLPASVYEHVAHADLRDLRVFNADGEIVPYAFVPPVPAPPPVARHPIAVYPLRTDNPARDLQEFTLSLRTGSGGVALDVRAPDGRVVQGSRVAALILDVSALDTPIDGLILTPAGDADVHARVRVDASDDLGSWRMVASAAPVLRLHFEGRTLARDRIGLPAVRARYLRITPDDGLPLPDFATVEAETGAAAAQRALPTLELAGTYTDNGVFEYDALGPFDVAEATLRLAAPNTVVPAQLSVRDDPKAPWRRVADGVFYRLGEGAGEARNPALQVHGAAYRYWRVELDPRSGITSASPPVLLLAWQPAEIVFASRGPPPFQVAFGRRNAQSGALPTTVLVPGFDARRGLAADAGIAVADATPQVGNRSALGIPVDFRRAALWGVLVLTVVVLAILGVRLLRQAPPNPPA